MSAPEPLTEDELASFPGGIDDRDKFDDDFDQDDGLDENGNIPFECAKFWIKGEGWFCPLQGTEECDWECPGS